MYVELWFLLIWVQVTNLPVGYMSEFIAKEIGNKLGGFLECDSESFTGAWREFLRIKVQLDVRKLIKQWL